MTPHGFGTAGLRGQSPRSDTVMTVYTGFARHHGAGKAALESGDTTL
jgi:hypothetical protein